MDTADIQKRTRTYMIAFIAIFVLALVAAGTALAGISNIYLIFSIAAIQATIILISMMHARADGLWVRGVLFFAVLFVAVLFGVLALAHSSTITGTERFQSAPAIAPADAEAH